MTTLSFTQHQLLQRFASHFTQWGEWADANPAIGGWSDNERRQMQSAYVERGASIFAGLPGASIRTVVALRDRGMIEHVGDGMHVITAAGLAHLSQHS
jgi:hypothetical protein